MACFLINRHDTIIRISDVEQNDNITVYLIMVKVGSISWIVHHRYSDFVELHDKLVLDHGVAKDILPPKKVIGNRDPAFVEKRRGALEQYLTSVVNFLQRAMPRELALFLDFHHYDILFMLQNLSMQFFLEGDSLLQMSRSYIFTPFQLHAVSERLKQPCPPLEILDNRYDFSHVLDFCCQLTCITIKGSNTPVGTSNIIPNLLPFELSAFKMVKKMIIAGFPVCNIYSVGTLRSTLTSLVVHNAKLEQITQVLLCDDLHKEVMYAGESHAWKNVVEADFSHNSIQCIDEGVKLMPNLEQLMLFNNKLSALSNLTSLPRLSYLGLSSNCFVEVIDFHMKLGNIRYIDLSFNSIGSLQGFSKLYSLEGLDLTSNEVSDLAEIRHISALPCLENVILTGNPVTIIVDYRVRVLEQFGTRSAEICLDNEKPSQKELDTVAVLQALRIVKEGRTPTFSPDSHSFP